MLDKILIINSFQNLIFLDLLDQSLMNKLGNKAWETRLPASMLCPSLFMQYAANTEAWKVLFST